MEVQCTEGNTRTSFRVRSGRLILL
jgi:hypothetical protein